MSAFLSPSTPATAACPANWHSPDLQTAPTGLIQRGKNGVALLDPYPWNTVNFSARIDTLRLLMPPMDADRRSEVCSALSRQLRVSLKTLTDDPHPMEDGNWVVAIQDITAKVFSAMPLAFDEQGIDWRTLKIVQLDIALDARLPDAVSDDDDRERIRLTQALFRHLSIEVSGERGTGPRWFNDVGKTIFAWPTAVGGMPGHQSSTLDWWSVASPNFKSSIYLGKKNVPLMYMVIHKTTDHRRGLSARKLLPVDRRVRIEARLRASELLKRGFRTLPDLANRHRLSQLQQLFPFECPVFDDPGSERSVRQIARLGLNRRGADAFAAYGMWGYRDHWRYRTRYMPKKITRKNGSRESTEYSLAPRAVSHPVLTRRVKKAFERFSASFDKAKRRLRSMPCPQL